MKRLLVLLALVSAVVFLSAPLTIRAQDESATDRIARRAREEAEQIRQRTDQIRERTEQQAEEIRQRTEDRAERIRQRTEERARRVQERIERRLDRFDDGSAHILFGKSYTLPEGNTVSEHVVVIGGSATVNGHAESDVTVVGGRLRIGPKAVIDGDVSVVGGGLDRDPAAQIAGDVDVARISLPDWDWDWEWASVVWPVFDQDWDDWWWHGAAATFTVGRVVIVLFVAMVLALVAPGFISSIAARLAGAPGVSAIAGFAAEILFAPAMVALAVALIITIVGIPLLLGLPLLGAAFALVWIVGYTAVCGVLGARLRGADWYSHGIGAIDVLLGGVALSSLTVIGQVLVLGPGWTLPFGLMVRGTGWTIEYIAWTVGLGAALTSWARTNGFNRGHVPPVVPPLPTAAGHPV